MKICGKYSFIILFFHHLEMIFIWNQYTRNSIPFFNPVAKFDKMKFYNIEKLFENIRQIVIYDSVLLVEKIFIWNRHRNSRNLIMSIAVASIFLQCNSLCLNFNMSPSKHMSDNSIKSIVFDPTGNKIAYGSKNGSIYILKMQNLEYVTTLNTHSGSVYALNYTKDGKYLISGGKDNKINIWPAKQYCKKENNCENDIQNLQYSDPLRQNGHTNKGCITLQSDNVILSVATSCITNPQIFAYGGLSNNIYVSNVTNNKIQICKAHKQGACCIKFNPQGTFFASGGADNIVMLWDLTTLKTKSTLGAHKDRINSILFNKNNPFSIIAGSKDNYISIWDIRQSTIKDLIKLKSSVISLEYDLDGNLITTDNQGRLNLRDKKNLHKSICKSRPIQKFHKVNYFSNDKSQFLVGIVGSEQRYLKTWNIADVLKVNKHLNLLHKYNLSHSRYRNSKFKRSFSQKNRNIKYNNLANIEKHLYLNGDNSSVNTKYSQNKPKINIVQDEKYDYKIPEGNSGISIAMNLDNPNLNWDWDLDLDPNPNPNLDIIELDSKKELDFLNKKKDNTINISPSNSLKDRKNIKYTSEEGTRINTNHYIQHAFDNSSPNKSIRDKDFNKGTIQENVSDFIYKPNTPLIDIENSKSLKNISHIDNDNILNHRNGLLNEDIKGIDEQIDFEHNDIDKLGHKPICLQCCNKDFCCKKKTIRATACCCSSCSGATCMSAAYFYHKIPYTQYLVCHSLSKYFLWGFGSMICLGSCCYCTCKLCRKYEYCGNCKFP